jgi:hypothetical protein
LLFFKKEFFRLFRYFITEPEDNLLDLVMKKIEGTPFDPNYKVVNKGSDIRISSPVYTRLQNGQSRSPKTNIDIQYSQLFNLNILYYHKPFLWANKL